MLKKNLLVFLIFCYGYSYSQGLNKLGSGSPWNKGFAILSDGDKHEGLIRNNDKEGIVSIKNEIDSSSISIRSSRIQSMEYFDSETGATRKFISLEVKELKSEYEGIVLFEVVREFANFAILIFKTPAIVIQSKNSVSYSGNGTPQNSGRAIISQFEMVYFMNQDGECERYMIFENRYVDGLFDFEKSKSRILDSSLPAKYVGNAKWDEVELRLNDKGVKKIKTKKELLEAIELL